MGGGADEESLTFELEGSPNRALQENKTYRR
jgi:hypothetical protein